jgi:hypothetical protein
MCRFVREVLITKDLITYEIDSSKKPIFMHEAVEGTGMSLFDGKIGTKTKLTN